MKIKKIYYTTHFAKKAAKLSRNLTKEVNKREQLFRTNPFHPTLKTHKLKGKLKNCYSFSITYSDRILFEFVADDEVLFYDIGGHEIYK